MKDLYKIFAITIFIWIIISLPNINKLKNIHKENFKLTLPIETIIKEKELLNKNSISNQTNTTVLNPNSNSTEYSNVSFDMNLTKPSKYTATDYDNILKDTNLNNLGTAFKECEQKGINSLFLIALSCHESSYGNSKLSTDKNNIFGYMAYDSNPYASAKYFYSKEACIDYVSDKLIKNYLSEDGCFYNGTTLTAVNQNYATDSNWDTKIYNIMLKLEKELDAI